MTTEHFHHTAMPDMAIEYETGEFLSWAFHNLFQVNEETIFVRWDDHRDLWTVAIWNKVTDKVAVYETQVGSDDNDLIFERLSADAPGFYKTVTIDLPPY